MAAFFPFIRANNPVETRFPREAAPMEDFEAEVARVALWALSDQPMASESRQVVGRGCCEVKATHTVSRLPWVDKILLIQDPLQVEWKLRNRFRAKPECRRPFKLDFSKLLGQEPMSRFNISGG
jgi:hypothetical protein